MRFWPLMVVLCLCLGMAAFAAPFGPLVAGTAPGPMSIAAPWYALGVHYPCDPPCRVSDYGAFTGSYPRPFNGTYPYNEWPDRALVPGKRPAMAADIVIQTSKKRN